MLCGRGGYAERMLGLPENWDVMERSPDLRESARGIRQFYFVVGVALAAGVFYLAFVAFAPPDPVVSLDSPNPALRVRAIGDCRDQAKLGNLALNDPKSEVRRAAVLRLLDTDILLQVIEEEEDDEIATLAMGRLHSGELVRQAMQRRNASLSSGSLRKR